MKKIGDIMEQMGFRKDAPESLKEAFLKNLIKSATGVAVETPSEKRERMSHPTQVEHPVQLSFDFESNTDSGKKVS